MLLIVFFLGTLLLSFSVVAVLTRPSKHAQVVHKRLDGLLVSARPVAQPDSPSDALLKEAVSEGLLARFDQFISRFGFYSKLQRLIVTAHRETSPGKVILQSLGLAVGCFTAVQVFVSSPMIAAVGTAVGAAVPTLLLKFHAGRRLKQFNAALPDSIDLMSRALKAGHSVSSAIEVVAQQALEPVASEFTEVFRSQNFGLPFRDALTQLADRVPSKDLRFVVTAMLVQKETGGNLTEILDRTTHVIRERMRIHGEIRTKTAQGRLTGAILAALPIILGVLINFADPGYARPLFTDPLGRKLLYAGGGMISIGAFIISRIVKIEV